MALFDNNGHSIGIIHSDPQDPSPFSSFLPPIPSFCLLLLPGLPFCSTFYLHFAYTPLPCCCVAAGRDLVWTGQTDCMQEHTHCTRRAARALHAFACFSLPPCHRPQLSLPFPTATAPTLPHHRTVPATLFIPLALCALLRPPVQFLLPCGMVRLDSTHSSVGVAGVVPGFTSLLNISLHMHCSSMTFALCTRIKLKHVHSRCLGLVTGQTGLGQTPHPHLLLCLHTCLQFSSMPSRIQTTAHPAIPLGHTSPYSLVPSPFFMWHVCGHGRWTAGYFFC